VRRRSSFTCISSADFEGVSSASGTFSTSATRRNIVSTQSPSRRATHAVVDDRVPESLLMVALAAIRGDASSIIRCASTALSKFGILNTLGAVHSTSRVKSTPTAGSKAAHVDFPSSPSAQSACACSGVTCLLAILCFLPTSVAGHM
jgi:hypothetical protein